MYGLDGSHTVGPISRFKSMFIH